MLQEQRARKDQATSTHDSEREARVKSKLALLTLYFPSVQYVWTTRLTTTINFSKLASDGWEYSLSKQRIAATLDGKASVFVYACQVGVAMP